MNTKHSDLIGIANPDLAERLNQVESGKPIDDADSAAHPPLEVLANPATNPFQTFHNDAWKAVYTLNLFRYATGIVLLIMLTSSSIEGGWKLIEQLLHPRLVFVCSVLVLASAVAFSYISQRRKQQFGMTITLQLALDLVLAAILTHSTGSLNSSFMLLYMVVVATGSVVLPRRQALGLAAGAIILMFFEHFYSVWTFHPAITANYSLLATNGVLLFAISLLIAWLAQRLRAAELQSFSPGQESIEDYLIREETQALKAALEQTDGNKTEAAKLLGMTFRSFRYKVTKYNIE